MISRKFNTEMSTEENVVDWEIQNFSKLQEMKSPSSDKTVTRFRAGESLEQSSSWKLELSFTPENEMSLFLYLEEGPTDQHRTCVFAHFDWSILDTNLKELIVPEVRTPVRKYMTANKAKGQWGYNNFVTLDKLRTVGALVNDILKIRVKIEIYGDEKVKVNETTSACSQESLKQHAVDVMGKHCATLLETGKGSDFVIRVKKLDSNEYFEKKVHRFILSARSPVFEVMLGSPMSEKETGIVTIKDLSPLGLDIFLEFMYTGNIPDEWKLVPEEILNAAEKYNLPLLKEYIDGWLHTACTPENAVSLFNLAKQHGLTKAFKNISEYIKSHLENVLGRT